MRFRILRAAGLVAVAALQLVWLFQPIPLALKLANVAFVALAIARPTTACLVLACIGPLAHSILAALAVPIAGTRLLEQLVLAVVTGAIVRWQPSDEPSRTAVPAIFVSLVAAASAASVLPGRLMAAGGDAATWHRVLQLWRGQHFNPDAVWAPFVVAVYTIEGMAFLWAVETTVRCERLLAGRLILCSLIGHAAAALLNFGQLVELASGSGPLASSLSKLFLTSRISLQYDRNAAGSVLVLVVLASIALLTRPWWRTVGVLGLVSALTVGVWLTGSRAALGALVLVLAGVGVSTARGRWRACAALGAALGLAVAAWLYVNYYPSGRNPSVEGSFAGRRTMAQVALHMAQSAPVFGIGIGTFYEQSTPFGSPPVSHLEGDIWVAVARPENAHNNFLQILAEQGAVGFLAVIALLMATLVPAIRNRASPPDPAIRWLLAGVAGFLLTWLTGHPLLEPDAVFVFALVLGLLAGLTAAPASRTRAVWLPALVAAVLFATIPARVRAENIRQIGVGLSAWQTDARGTAYREAGTTFSLWFPTHRQIVLPMRTNESVGFVRVELRVDGETMRVLTLTDAWQTVSLPLSTNRWGYARIDFRVAADRAGEQPPVRLAVGAPGMQ